MNFSNQSLTMAEDPMLEKVAAGPNGLGVELEVVENSDGGA